MWVRVAAERCSSCIFGPNSPIDAERTREIAQAWKDQNTHQICHQFGVGDSETGELVGENVVCRGWYETQRIGEIDGVDDEALRQIAERLGVVEFVALPESG